jgi:hypothetical protein
VANGHLRDAGVRRLKAGEHDGFGDVFRVHHVGLADVVSGAALAQGELGLGAARADAPDVYVVLAKL